MDEFTAKLDYPMLVLTVPAPAGGRPAGCLVGFATQCSITPPRFLVCVSKANHTFRTLPGARMVGVHLLSTADHDLAELFGERTGDEVDKFFVAQKIGADLRHPVHLRVRCDDVAQQRFGALGVDGKIIVNKKHRDLAAFFPRARFQ